MHTHSLTVHTYTGYVRKQRDVPARSRVRRGKGGSSWPGYANRFLKRVGALFLMPFVLAQLRTCSGIAWLYCWDATRLRGNFRRDRDNGPVFLVVRQRYVNLNFSRSIRASFTYSGNSDWFNLLVQIDRAAVILLLELQGGVKKCGVIRYKTQLISIIKPLYNHKCINHRSMDRIP